MIAHRLKGELSYFSAIAAEQTSATSGTSEKELLGIADAALYQAKNAGRNRTVLL